MIKSLYSCVLAPGMLMFLSLPVPAETVSVSIVSALAPTACTPTLTGGGVVNYGTILTSQLSATVFTALPIRQIGLTISCDAPAKVAIKSLSGRIGSLAGSTESPQGVGLNPVTLLGIASGFPVVALGFDIDGTTKIGGYAIGTLVGSFTADGVAVAIVGQRSATTPTSWVAQNDSTANSSLYTSFNGQFKYVSWASASTVIPVAAQIFTGTLRLQAYLNRTTAFNFNHPIHLNGLSTLEIIYL